MAMFGVLRYLFVKTGSNGARMSEVEVAAECKGIKVPRSPFLSETRISRINAARYEGDEIAGALAVVGT